MNWYKKTQNREIEENPYYMDIGHPQEDPDNEGRMVLWISDLAGGHFNTAEVEGDSYDHSGLAYDSGFDSNAPTFQGRYDESKNIVSFFTDHRVATVRNIPNRLINKLRQEFGNAIIIDYTMPTPKIVI